MATNWECFREAVLVLAGSGPVKQRLAEAYQRHLASLRPEDLPREVRERFTELQSSLRCCGRMGSLDSVSASALKLSEHEAAAHARSVVDIFVSIGDAGAPLQVAQRTGPALHAVSDDEIPAFLNRA
jgi:hypothetical protein